MQSSLRFRGQRPPRRYHHRSLERPRRTGRRRCRMSSTNCGGQRRGLTRRTCGRCRITARFHGRSGRPTFRLAIASVLHRPGWAEIYATGHTGKAYAKEFVKNRGLAESSDARELIAVLSAIDSMLLQDQAPDTINSVALERLAKKGFGIISAFRDVERKEDWKKPGSAPKGWKSKVNEELWRRIDPARAGADETSIVNRKLEEEIRGEMDRDAALLKAFSKLEGASRSTAD